MVRRRPVYIGEMTIDGLLTVLALFAAIYAVLTPIQRLRLTLSWRPQTLVALPAFALILALELGSVSPPTCPADPAAWCRWLILDNADPGSAKKLAFIVALIWLAAAVAINRSHRPGLGSVPSIARMAIALIDEERYAEALELVEPNMPLLKQKDEPHPTARKSETGAIDRIELYGPSDRRSFSVAQAVAWLSRPATGGSYQVELFEALPPRSEWDRLDAGQRRLVESFLAGFSQLERGLTVERLPNSRNKHPLLSVRLDQSGDQPVLQLTGSPVSERRRELAPFSPDTARHARLLAFLDNHPLVRRIELPGIVVRASQPANAVARVRPTDIALPVRDSRRTHPRIGIIDGGISDALSDSVIDRWDILADEDADLAHGTFIGGLAAVGGALNGVEICPEPDGAELVDVAVFPNERKAGAFASYYPEGLPQFFDEMETAVSDARARHGVRVFNMSLNILQPAAPDRYSLHAARLDHIAESNNAIMFISAGNIQPQDLRAEWPVDATAALANLATARNDSLLTPAESARNVAVAALNPPGHGGCVPFAPARYSRRGPGLRAGVKPDLAHIGGAGSLHPELGHGLFSILPDGTIVDGCGTSYAAPLAAKTAAVLDHAIEGEVSRETLIGLMVHHAEMPVPLQSKELAPIARHMVGFGLPPSADRILETGDHSITLVFASRIQRDQQINFRFPWPASLVGPGGKCRGRAKITLVSTPPLDARFGSEFVRVNINATLQQETAKGGWKGQLEPLYLPSKREAPAIEAERIEYDLKWSPVKVLAKTFPRGVGASTNWRLFVDYLTRAGEVRYSTTCGSMPALRIIASVLRDVPQAGLW